MLSGTAADDIDCQVDVLPFADWVYWLVTSIIAVLMLINIPVNTYTLYCLVTRKTVTGQGRRGGIRGGRPAMEYFIGAFLFADIFSALISPLWVIRRLWQYSNWKLPTSVCVLFFIVDELASYTTSFMVLSISVVRFAAIWDPFAAQSRDAWYWRKWVAGVVFLALPGTVMIGLCGGVRHRVGECNYQLGNTSTIDHHNHYWPDCTLTFDHGTYYMDEEDLIGIMMAIQVIYFYIPMLLIMIIGIATVLVLQTRAQVQLENRTNAGIQANRSAVSSRVVASREEEQKHLVKMLWAINLIYFLGYIPYSTYWAWQTSGAKQWNPSEKTPTSAHNLTDILWLYSGYIMRRISETVHPVVYYYYIQFYRKRRQTHSQHGSGSSFAWSTMRGRIDSVFRWRRQSSRDSTVDEITERNTRLNSIPNLSHTPAAKVKSASMSNITTLSVLRPTNFYNDMSSSQPSLLRRAPTLETLPENEVFHESEEHCGVSNHGYDE